ncbi:hypothetical protein [Nocardiopsis lucentensis]|uniref:hypothetical protein n=1 Tax=Nocardiopsis lucentensis TaxID=53441 RepID=UPI001F4D25F4|nr:hypothetical protein [Nocardiopsis lucentensis]
MAERFADHGAAMAASALTWPWTAHAVALGATAVTLLAVRWLLVQARTNRLRWLRPGPDTGAGCTGVAAVAVGAALVDRLRSDPRVLRGRARFTECAREPRLWLDLELTEDADPVDVWRGVREDGLTSLRLSLELERLPTVIRVTVPRRPTGRRLA